MITHVITSSGPRIGSPIPSVTGNRARRAHLTTTLVRRFVLLLLVFASSWGASTAIAQQIPVEQDASALANLNNMMAATGWNAALPTLSDVRVTVMATSTSPDGTQTQSTSTIRVRQRTQLRADDSSGNILYVRSGGKASIVVNGTAQALPPHVARFYYPYMLPMLTPLTTYVDPTVRLLDKGIVTIGGEQYYSIEIGERDPEHRAHVYGHLGWHATVYLSTTTYLPYQMTVDWPSVSREQSTAPMTWIWSNYQNEQGLMVPLTTQQQTGDRITATSVVQSLNLNTGLQDSDFPIGQ